MLSFADQAKCAVAVEIGSNPMPNPFKDNLLHSQTGSVNMFANISTTLECIKHIGACLVNLTKRRLNYYEFKFRSIRLPLTCLRTLLYLVETT